MLHDAEREGRHSGVDKHRHDNVPGRGVGLRASGDPSPKILNPNAKTLTTKG